MNGKTESGVEKGLTAIAVALAVYMVYASLYGPYKTTIVHLALYLMVALVIYYLQQPGGDVKRHSRRRMLDWLMALATIASLGYVIIEFERVMNLFGAPFLTTGDLVFGTFLVAVVLEASRRESLGFFLLSILGILYILFGWLLPGILNHPGMDYPRFIYLTAYTSEGVFGLGLRVASSYLFMFLLLSSAMTKTKTGDFIINLCNAFVGHKAGGPAKSAVLASAGLGTMVGSSIGNVVTTGTFTIPLMKRTGFPPHKAGAIEVVASEGSQFLPPVMGAGAFLMAEFTDISYATIALAAVLPALLYYISTFTVVHIESLRMGLTGLPKNEIPNARQVLRDGWHLLIPPFLLLYLLMVEQYSPNYAGMVCVLVSLMVAMFRRRTRLNLKDLIQLLDNGVRQAAKVTALIAAIGFIQQAVVTTGLGPRLTEIILLASEGSLFFTLILAVVVATLIGMGMPTSISYILLAMFVAPALERVGVPTLAAHLFIFYFAIKSGSTPPVAVVAVVAAGIAQANWWKTGVAAFLYSLPGFIVAFMFIYSPQLLARGTVLETLAAFVTATVGVIGIAAGLQGWMGSWLTGYFGWCQRGLLLVGSVLLVEYGAITDAIGAVCVVFVFLYQRLGHRTPDPKIAEASSSSQR